VPVIPLPVVVLDTDVGVGAVLICVFCEAKSKLAKLIIY
jgi:hypothetical protein